MNILLGVHQFFPEAYMGTERYALNLATNLQALGHQVRVLTYDYWAKAVRQTPSGRMFMREYTYQNIPVTALSHRDSYDFTFELLDEDFVLEAEALLDQHKTDVFLCAHPMRIGGCLAAASRKGIPSVLMLTDFWLLCPRGTLLRKDLQVCDGPRGGENCVEFCFDTKGVGEFRQRERAARYLSGLADKVLSPSLFLIGVFDFNGFFENERVDLARHGFDYGDIDRAKLPKRLEPSRIVIGYTGTVQYHKGVHVLVEAFTKVQASNLRLEIWGASFGDTDYGARVRRLAGDDERITFHGEYRHADLGQILERIDIMAVPSVWYENAPLTLSQSHACGIPAIASDRGGMAERVFDGVNGNTFRMGQPDALAEKLRAIAEDPMLIEKFREHLVPPPRLEEEVFRTDRLLRTLVRLKPAVT